MIFLIVDGGFKPSTGGYGSCLVLQGTMLESEPHHLIDEVPREIFRKSWARLPEAVTNNQAEYGALLETLRWFRECFPTSSELCKVVVVLDSQLVIKQVSGEWRCLNDDLKKLKKKVLWELGRFGEVTLRWVSREKMVQWLGH